MLIFTFQSTKIIRNCYNSSTKIQLTNSSVSLSAFPWPHVSSPELQRWLQQPSDVNMPIYVDDWLIIGLSHQITQETLSKTVETHSKAWIHHQHREIFRDPYSDTYMYISWGMPGYHHRQSLSITRSMLSPGGMYSSVPFCNIPSSNIPSSSSMAAAFGFHGQFGGLSSMVQDAHASTFFIIIALSQTLSPIQFQFLHLFKHIYIGG